MGKIKKIVNGVVVEVDENQPVKTIVDGVVVEKPFSEVKKKEVSDGGGTTAPVAPVSGGTVGSSAPLSEREKIANYVKTLGGGVKQVSGDKTVGNLKAITQTKTTKKPETTFDQTKEEAVSGGINKINEIMYDTNDDWKDPIKVSLEKSVDRTQGNKSNLEYLAANVLARDAILKSGYNASKMLETTPIWAMAKPGENMTADLLKQKTAEFKNKVQPFEGIELNELDNGEGGGNDDFYKYVYGDKIYNAAIKAHALKNPNFKEQLLAKGATYEDFENGDLMKFVPSGKLGQIVSESVYDPDVAEYLKNEKPYLFNGLKAVASSLIEDDKDFGANVVANKISREFLKKRKLNPLEYVADFATQGLKDEINEFAKANLTEQEYRVYQNRILGNEERYLDTPSLLEGFASGGKQIFSGIKSTFTTPFKSQSEIIDEGWKQEASNVSADPEGMLKFLRDSGHTLGIVGGIASLGGPLGGGGSGFYATKVVPALSGTIPFLGDMLQEGTMKYPDSPVKAWTSAMFNTALYAALSYRIFPAKDVEKAFTAVKPEVAVVVKNLTNGSITREVARKEMNTIAVKALDFLAGTQLKSGKIAAELTGISALNQMLDKVMGMDDKTYEKYHPEGELSDTFGSLFLSNQFVGGLAKYGEMKRGNRIVEASLYEAASNPLKFQREVELLKTKDESIDTNQILDNLKFLTDVKKELDARGIKPSNQGRYMFEAMKEKVFADAVKSTPDSNMIRPMKESIKRGEEIKESILEGEDVVGNEQFELQKENKALSADQIAIQKALEGKEIKDALFASIAESAMKDPELAAQLVADIKSQATGEVAGEIGNAKSGQINSFGEGLVEYAINKKEGEPERVSQPIELDPTLPEGYELPGQPKVEAGSVGLKQTNNSGSKYDSFDIIVSGEKVGVIDIDKGDTNSVHIIDISPEFQGKGVAGIVYEQLAEKYGELSSSKPEYMEDNSIKVWDKLVKKGVAVKNVDGSYIIKLTEQSLKEQPQASTPKSEIDTQKEAIETEKQQAITEATKPVVEAKEVKPEPPNIPPSEPKPVKEGGETKGVSKAILKRIVESENISKSVKENLEKDLRYTPQSHDEARKIAKDIVKEFGEDEAVTFAESGKFGGDVNSMIFAEAIDRTFEKEQSAKTPEEKMKYAEQWADYADRYDKSARKSGRMISAVGSFYKNSPVGFMLKKRGEREQEFKEWYKGREKPFKEVFEEMKNDPDFKAYMKLEVQKATKQERAVFRQKRRTKIVDAFNKAKIKTNQVNSAIIPPQVWNAAVEVMKQATLAGEHILDVIEKGVEHIKNNHKDAWDEKAFREDWKERLEGLDSDKQRVEVPEKYLERMRKKLSGMTESQKEDVIRKSFRKLVENGALEYDDFKKIVADTIGLGELSAEDVAKIQSYIKDMNDVQDLQERVVSENSKEALEAFEMGRKKAEKSATELASMVYNKPDVGKRLRSIAQLSTMSIVSLVKNPFYNIFHQLLVRMPKAVIMTSIDHTVWGISLLANKMFGTKVINPDFNVIAAQRGYFGGVAEGGKMAVKQLFTGLTNKDYFQKEVYNSQIKPFQSWKDIWDWGRGNKYLTGAQIADKVIQGTVGIPAEFVARMLNIGDKPFRFAAESAIAETIATQDLHLHGIDRKIFLAMPKEKAKDIFLKRGLSEEEAALKAEKIEQRIIKEGEEAVFQQANIISEKIEQLKKASNENAEKNPLAGFGNEAARWFGVLNMPFVKTPVNIAWEVFNLVNPEFALMQSFVYGARAAKTKSQADYIQAKKWMAHAATGLALMSAAGYLASIGAVTGDDEDQAFNMKEAKGKEAFAKNNRLNWSKLNRAVTGGSTKDMDGDVMVDLSWWGAPGMILNMQANKQENMTKEEREKMGYVEDLLYRLKSGARDGLVNSVFSGTFTAVDAMRTGKADQWLLGMMNVGMNIFEPATVAQLSRAMQKNEYRVTDDDFSKKAQNSIKSRFFGTPPTKYNIWGDPMKKDNSFKGILWNMFGFSSFDKDAIGEPVYQDFKRTGDYNFFPSVPQPDFEVDGEKKQLPREQLDQFQVLVGQARKNYAQPFLADAAILTGYDKKYSQLSDPEKLEALKEIYKKGYDAGKEQFLALHPEYDTREKEPDYEGDLKKKTFKSSLDYQ